MTEHSPLAPPASLDWRRIAHTRAGTRLGHRVVYHARLDSTNVLARALLRDGAPDGTVVLADEQTQGRGRLGRRWLAPSCSGLALSVCLRPPPGFPLPTLSMAAALAAGDVVRAVAGTSCALKWPNDVLVDGAKVCGILLELDEADGAWSVVVGIGLNVNAAPDLPGVTCLAAITGAPLEREPLLLGLLAALERYVDLAGCAPEMVWRAWRERLETVGRRVRVSAPDGAVEGVAEGVDDEGALLLRLDDGTWRTLHAGAVTLAAPPESTAR